MELFPPLKSSPPLNLEGTEEAVVDEGIEEATQLNLTIQVAKHSTLADQWKGSSSSSDSLPHTGYGGILRSHISTQDSTVSRGPKDHHHHHHNTIIDMNQMPFTSTSPSTSGDGVVEPNLDSAENTTILAEENNHPHSNPKQKHMNPLPVHHYHHHHHLQQQEEQNHLPPQIQYPPPHYQQQQKHLLDQPLPHLNKNSVISSITNLCRSSKRERSSSYSSSSSSANSSADLIQEEMNANASLQYMSEACHNNVYDANPDNHGMTGSKFGGVISSSRKKLRLSTEQSFLLEESFKEHNTLNPVNLLNILDHQLNH